jgi:flagellar hook-associated protein 2
MAVNLNNLSVDSSGRVTFSGLGSGIDYKTAVDQIIAAKRIPVDRIEAQVETNKAKTEALKEVRSLLSTLKDSLNGLRGAVSVGGAADSFKAKQAFTSTSRTDGLSPSTAANLVGVSVTNAATLGSREIEVLRVAKAHKVGSGSFTSLTADMGTARGTGAGSVAGSFTLNGKTITVSGTDTLLDLRDRVNNANTGTTPSGVSASIVSVGASEHYLVLTNDKTGVATAFAGETGSVLNELGISADGGATFSNELQAAQTARLKADGLQDPDRFESDLLGSTSASLSTIAPGATYPGSFAISGAAAATINYTSTTSLADLAQAINDETGTTGVTASIMADGLGFRLVLTRAGGAFTLTDSGGLLGRLGVDNEQVIERASNTVDDLYPGVTLSLYAAEENTKVKIDVDRNLSAIKSQVIAFKDAYNAVKQKINEHQFVDPTTGAKTDETGALFGSSTINDVETQLAGLIGGGVQGVAPNFSVLAQVGLTFVDNGSLEDPTEESTLTLDESALDKALLNNPEDVRRLFSFDFTSSDSRFVLVGFAGATRYASAGYTLNVGNVGAAQMASETVTSTSALLNDGVNSVGATTSGSFQINGVGVPYDVTTDSLDSLAAAITAAAIPGVTAGISGGKLHISSSSTPLTVSGDTGDLVAALSLTTSAYLVGRANIGGAADGTDNGTVTIAGNVVTATSGTDANGLKLLYTGNGDVGGVSLDFTVGFGAQMFFAIESMLDTTSGVIETDIAAMEDESETAKSRIADMEARLDIQRRSLTDRFLAMEEAVNRMNRILESINQISKSLEPRN